LYRFEPGRKYHAACPRPYELNRVTSDASNTTCRALEGANFSEERKITLAGKNNMYGSNAGISPPPPTAYAGRLTPGLHRPGYKNVCGNCENRTTTTEFEQSNRNNTETLHTRRRDLGRAKTMAPLAKAQKNT